MMAREAEQLAARLGGPMSGLRKLVRCEDGSILDSYEPLPSTVRLKNGAEEPWFLVKALLGSLQGLLADHPIAFYELVMLCRDREHEIWSEPMADVLKERGLLEPGGTIHSSIRSVVLSAVEGDGPEMHLTSPYAEEAHGR